MRQVTIEEFHNIMCIPRLEWEDSHREWVVTATVRYIYARKDYLDALLLVERYRYDHQVLQTPYDDQLHHAQQQLEEAEQHRGWNFNLTFSETIEVYQQIDPALWLGVQGGYYHTVGADTSSLFLPHDSLTYWCKGGDYDPTVVWKSLYSPRHIKIVGLQLVPYPGQNLD